MYPAKRAAQSSVYYRMTHLKSSRAKQDTKCKKVKVKSRMFAKSSKLRRGSDSVTQVHFLSGVHISEN